MNPLVSGLLRIVLIAAGLGVTFLPRWAELRLGPCLGRLLLCWKNTRRRVAEENLRNCFPDKSENDRCFLLRAHYEHLGTLLLELLHLVSPIPGHYRHYVKKNSVLEGFEHWLAAQQAGKGVLFVSSHLGNWEFMVGAGALAGIPITMVTKHLKPQWLHEKIERSRASLGVKATYEPRTLPTVMKALKKGEAVGFVMDQYAGPPMGIEVPVFGVKVGTLAAVATLVDRTGAQVVMAKTYRDTNGVVHTCIEPPLEWLSGEEKNSYVTTAKLTANVEHWVREYPAQWYWIHRRFKNVIWPSS